MSDFFNNQPQQTREIDGTPFYPRPERQSNTGVEVECPKCGSVPSGSPEGMNADGSPAWQQPHCWKCGYRPPVEVDR